MHIVESIPLEKFLYCANCQSEEKTCCDLTNVASDTIEFVQIEFKFEEIFFLEQRTGLAHTPIVTDFPLTGQQRVGRVGSSHRCVNPHLSSHAMQFREQTSWGSTQRMEVFVFR